MRNDFKGVFMTEKQIKEIENYIISNIGLNNPNTEKLKDFALKFKEFYEKAQELPVELRPFATLLVGYVANLK